MSELSLACLNGAELARSSFVAFIRTQPDKQVHGSQATHTSSKCDLRYRRVWATDSSGSSARVCV